MLDNNRALIKLVIAGVMLIVSALWFLSTTGYESLLGVLGAISFMLDASTDIRSKLSTYPKESIQHSLSKQRPSRKQAPPPSPLSENERLAAMRELERLEEIKCKWSLLGPARLDRRYLSRLGRKSPIIIIFLLSVLPVYMVVILLGGIAASWIGLDDSFTGIGILLVFLSAPAYANLYYKAIVYWQIKKLIKTIWPSGIT